jgi:hypothetical protein
MWVKNGSENFVLRIDPHVARRIGGMPTHSEAALLALVRYFLNFGRSAVHSDDEIKGERPVCVNLLPRKLLRLWAQITHSS